MGLILQGRFAAFVLSITSAVLLLVAELIWPVLAYYLWLPLIIALALVAVGIHDVNQTRHAILRNYPIIGHIRFFLEKNPPGNAAVFL